MADVVTPPLPRSIDDSLATLAHELRDPLATILFALEMISEERDGNPIVSRACAIAEKQARRVARIVDDLFDLCASSRDRLVLDKQLVELAGIVSVAIETIAHRLDAQKHELTVSLPHEPVYLRADSLRLEQVLTNLLTNAAKFTEPGGQICVTGEIEAEHVIVRIRDSGRGICPEHLPHIFDLTFQIDPSRRIEGLGIGLPLAKSLVEMHGGSISVTSGGLGLGTEFQVRLPARTGETVCVKKL